MQESIDIVAKANNTPRLYDDDGGSMEILFTTTDLPVSRLIRHVTKEPVSHCAVRIGEFVIHSSFSGVEILPYSVFASKYKIIYRIYSITYPLKVYKTLKKYYGHPYDFGALLYLGLRALLPKSWTKKRNLWQTSGMFLCTEFVTTFIDDKEDSMITPYQLYLRLTTFDNKL